MNAPVPESELILLRAGDLACVRILGRAHFACAPCIRDALDELLSTHPSRIIFDLEHCQYMDSTFLGVLTRLAEKFRQSATAPRSLELYNASPRIPALFTSLGVSALFELKTGTLPLPTGCPASQISTVGVTKIQLKETSLAAHEDLIRINDANQAKFAELTNTLRDDLARLKAGEPPVLPGFDIAALLRQAGDVGGDFYDFVPRSGLRVGVLIADVSGKGQRAAAVAAQCRPLLHAQLAIEQPPAAVFGKVLPGLFQVLPDGMFVTALCVVLDSARRSLRVARAGHEPLLWFHAATKTVERIEPKGMALGIDRARMLDDTFLEHEHVLAPGDILLLYTDGITDTLDSASCEFGVARLEAGMIEAAQLDAKAITKKIFAEVEEFVKGASQTDDRTLIVIKAE